jgi:hypothetical protein
MPGSRKKTSVFVLNYVRKLRGGSQPILAQANDGLLYVVKFNNNLQGPNVAFNESMGTELYRACGLPVQPWRPVMVTQMFLDEHPSCWMQTERGALRPDTGRCFGSRFLPENGDRPNLQILPESFLPRVHNRDSFWLAWLIDVCAAHQDGRQVVFDQEATGRINAHFIDHAYLFGGPLGSYGKENQHIGRCGHFDLRIYGKISSARLRKFQNRVLALDSERLWRLTETLPDDWKKTSAMDSFAQCLNRLATSSHLRSVSDMMVDFVQLMQIRREGKRAQSILDILQLVKENELGRLQNRRRVSDSILRSGVQEAESERSCADYSDCA